MSHQRSSDEIVSPGDQVCVTLVKWLVCPGAESRKESFGVSPVCEVTHVQKIAGPGFQIAMDHRLTSVITMRLSYYGRRCNMRFG